MLQNFSLFRFSDKELKTLLTSVIILIDSREQKHQHIVSFLDEQRILHKVVKLEVGDYSVMLPRNPEMGIQRDLYIPVAIERKAHIDELIGNFKTDKRTAFQNELIRSQGKDFVLLVEQGSGYGDILAGNYRSEMKRQSVIGTLKAFEARYNFHTIFIDKQFSPSWVHHHLYYRTRNFLKGC